MTVYIEYVLIDNIVIDYIILKFIELTLHNKIRKINKLLVCALGGTFALIMPLFIHLKMISFLYKFAISLILVFSIKKYKNFKNFLTYYLLFFAYTFFIGGVCLGVIEILNIDYTMSSVVMYNLEFPMGLLLLITLIVLKLFMMVIKYARNKIKESNYIYNCKIIDKGKEVEVNGFLDTGNKIYYQNNAVSIITIDVFLRLYNELDYSQLILKNIQKNDIANAEYISVRGIGNEEKYLSFTPEKIIINKKEIVRPRLAVSWRNLGEYELVLHNDLIGGEL